MVTKLEKYSKDPNGKNRGPGLYYHRGHGYFSIYSVDRDLKKLSSGWKVHKIGFSVNKKGKKTTSLIQHTTDGKIHR